MLNLYSDFSPFLLEQTPEVDLENLSDNIPPFFINTLDNDIYTFLGKVAIYIPNQPYTLAYLLLSKNANLVLVEPNNLVDFYFESVEDSINFVKSCIANKTDDICPLFSYYLNYYYKIKDKDGYFKSFCVLPFLVSKNVVHYCVFAYKFDVILDINPRQYLPIDKQTLITSTLNLTFDELSTTKYPSWELFNNIDGYRSFDFVSEYKKLPNFVDFEKIDEIISKADEIEHGRVE